MADINGSTDQEPGSADRGIHSKPSQVPLEEQPTLTTNSSPEQHGMMIGDYRIIRKIGAGGMGVVYEAEQQHPKRLVALKVIQGGRLVDEYQIKLFEREAQALARLKHPGIAAIYESGRTDEGQHFFAMELVRGETLKDYLAKTGTGGALSPAQLRERLAIFRKVSDAVTYAHQRGVIHRDLKPSNIIVQREFDSSDSQHEPQTPGIKILDFGLARITETDLAVATIGTEVGRIQGTLPYMSPEQVRGNPDEIDVRSDVYSLGVILYEMIAGHRPYNVHKAMLHEAARVICETPPEPISKSWTGSKRLDKDIETIVDKALEKQAPRRYQSVSALAEDISRFLTGQPILARPPSTAYQLQKLIMRHKIGFGFAASLVVLITVFAVVMSIQAERIARARDQADREAKISKQVSDFMQSLFRAPDPFSGKGKEVTAKEILDEGSARIAVELKDQPEVQAELMLYMAESYRGLGLYDKATELAQAALTVGQRQLGQETRATINGLSLLGTLKMDKGDFVNAEKMMREALELRRKALGPDSTWVALDINNIAMLNYRKGDWKKAEEGLRESLAIHRKVLGEDSQEVSTSLSNLAMVLKDQEKFTEAEPLYQEALSIRRKILGPAHPLVASSLNNLAMLYLRVKNYAEAEKLFVEALSIDRKALGDSHPEVGVMLNNLGLLNLNRGQLPQAEEYYRQALAVDEKTFGESNPELAGRLQNLGVVLTRQKKFADAEEFLRKAISLKLLQFDPNHWEVATTKNLLGACLVDEKKFKDAEPLLAESYAVIKKQFGLQHDRTRRAGGRLVTLYEASGQKDKAAALKAELGPLK
jgi:serine/threonine protein kinase/Tfp pilus assembly protein PilF